MVCEHLTQMHQRGPFQLQDPVELCLLDSAQQPLALLSSVLAQSAIDLDEPIVMSNLYIELHPSPSGVRSICMARISGAKNNIAKSGVGLMSEMCQLQPVSDQGSMAASYCKRK